MLSVNFASRARLGRIGPGAADVDGNNNEVALSSDLSLSFLTLNLAGPDGPGGTAVKAMEETEPTRLWNGKISTPRISGSGARVVQFRRGAVFEDLGDALKFLTDLVAPLAPSAVRDLLPDKAVELIDLARDLVDTASRLMSAGAGLIFAPGGQAAEALAEITFGRSVTSFDMRGLLDLA